MLPFAPLALLTVALCVVGGTGCARRDGDSGDATTIRVDGSDTMVNVAQAWAENYHALRPEMSVQVLGSGSGVGIASLINGTCDLANSSRKMTPKELDRARAERGAAPVEHIVGYDALAICVHLDNPMETISLEELAQIYGQDGTITRWTQLGIDPPRRDEIIRVSRQNSSGTYAYFRSVVLGKGRDFKLGSIDQSGSKDVVALVGRTPSAIGYSGMGYMTDEVKVLPVSRKKGEPGVAPTVANVNSGAYPITRPLLVYAASDAREAAAEYLAWILGSPGQAIVAELGYVPATGRGAGANQPSPAADRSSKALRPDLGSRI